MFNLTSQITRFFSWIKTRQDQQNSLIVQEQLGNIVHQVVIDQSPVQTNNNNRIHREHDEADITTSFNLTSPNNSLNLNNTNTIDSPNLTNSSHHSYNRIVESSPMQYQTSSSLLLGNTNETSSNVNGTTTQQPSGARNNRRHRRHRHGHRSSRAQSAHRSATNAIVNRTASSHQHASNSSHNNSSSFAMNLFSAKRTERNILSASCAVFCISILAVSLVEIRWFYLNGGGCNVNYVGVAHFFAPGRLEYQFELSKVDRSKEITVYKFILPNGLVLKNCANREIMLIMRATIAFVFLAIFSSCIALILDTFGCMRPGIKLVRRHGVFHILTVVFCLIINGFCFWISEKMYEQQNETREKKGKKIDITFDVSYYLIVLASGLSILATAFTLIRRYPTDEDEQLERLLEEYTGFEEPVHLERSLPAIVQPCNAPFTANSVNPNQIILNNLLSTNNYGGNLILTRLESRQNLPLPPPPATPPPSLHVNISNPNARRNSNSSVDQPPPPYDPTPVIA